jgi:8-oxo-dGTP pyrophosphatase MutT (NUDIX family)
MSQQSFDPKSDLPAYRRPAGARAVKPRHAATLIILRRERRKISVLMGRRHGGHDFMPDKWVFPGGRIDRSDYKAPFAEDLRPEVAGELAVHAPRNLGRALALTAIRETFEEAGLLLAKKAPVRPGAGPWREFLAQGALPDLSGMSFIARAITPPMSPKRFDARFFMAEATSLLSMERQADCGELDEIAWVELDAALELDLPTVTRFVLREIPHRLADPGRQVPYLRMARGGRSFGDL